MHITGLSPAEPSVYARDRERDGKRTAHGETSRRSRFSSAHVILDLSREAMKQIGQEPLSRSRPAKPVLFIYDHSGAFAYDEPTPLNDARHAASPTRRSSTETGEIDEDRTEIPLPNIVAFDGMLGTSSI